MSISKFIPYTNKDAGFNSIVPEGWTNNSLPTGIVTFLFTDIVGSTLL